MLTEPLAVTVLATTILEQLEIPYVIGGSFASALHGVMRATMDTDIVAAVQPEQVTPLIQALAGIFYADEEMIRTAVLRHSSFNVIHLATMFKVDIFVAKPRPFDVEQLARRQLVDLGDVVPQTVYIATAEDTILAKLEWYRLGGEVSERQWRDVLGILAIQDTRLDWVYLRRMAQILHVTDLLTRVSTQAGVPPET